MIPAHSGTAGSPIVYAAAGDGPVVIDGADVLDGWSRVVGSDHVWRASYPVPFASTLNQHEQLFCDGAMLWTARTPDRPVGRGLFHPDAVLRVSAVQSIDDLGQGSATPWGPVAKGGARRITFTCDALDDPDGAWPAGATLGIQPHENQSWGFWCIGPIESYADGQITAVVFTSISQDQHAFSRVTAGTPFFLTRGDGSELDAPGEWYHDRADGSIRVWLPDGGDPNEHVMRIKQRDYAFDLSGLAHIELRDLSVEAATITTDNLLGDGVGMGAWLTHNRGSVDIPAVQGNASAHHITLDSIDLRHLNHFHGTWGNYHGQWIMSSGLMIAGTAHTVRDCHIAQTAGNGIVLFGTDHRVTDTLIHDVNYSGVHASGIYIAQTPGNTPGTPVKPDRIEIDHNTLVCAGWGLIDGSSLYTSDPATPSRIHHNHISAAGLLTRDVGGIRFVGHTVGNPPRTGATRIDHNVVRNVVAALGNPIYFDFCDDYVVDHNLIYDCNQGININDANNLTVTNNTMIGFGGGIGGVSRDDSDFFNMADTLVRNNICAGSVLDGGGHIDPSYTADHNLEQATDALFIDPAAGDYRLRADASAAIDAGSTAVPNPGALAGAPDIGCFERGHDDWLAEVGVSTPVHSRPTDVVARARRDGTVDITWQDTTGGTAAHWIDRGYKTDHPNGGWEFLTVGRAAPGTTRFVDVLAGVPA
ncbi:MAG: right-handed parallel beta-helix repeat-containing protein, partial [Planctomycetota bacterium]